jgi:hypothetical protein
MDGFIALRRRVQDPTADADRPSMKAFALVSALISGGCLLSGCAGTGTSAGSGAGPSQAASSSNSLAAKASSAAGRAPSRAQALAFARAVNLSASDIPEASIAPKRSSAPRANERSEERACERLVTHQHLFPRSHLAEASSPRLKRGRELEVEEMSSSVIVLSNARTIPSIFAALQTPAVRACFARALTRNFSEKAVREAHWGRFEISKIPISAPGADALVGLRVAGTLSFSYTEVTLPFYVDVLGFAIGHAGVTLTAFSMTQPVPATTEQELVGLLLARAKGHPI